MRGWPGVRELAAFRKKEENTYLIQLFGVLGPTPCIPLHQTQADHLPVGHLRRKCELSFFKAR